MYILYTIVVLPRDDIRPDKGQARSTGINSGGTGGTNSGSHVRRFYLLSTSVFSALEVFTRMRYINPHLTFNIYLLTYFYTDSGRLVVVWQM